MKHFHNSEMPRASSSSGVETSTSSAIDGEKLTEPNFEITLEGDAKRKSHDDLMSDNLKKKQKLCVQHTALLAKKEEIAKDLKIWQQEISRINQYFERRQCEIVQESTLLLDDMKKNKIEYDRLKLQKK